MKKIFAGILALVVLTVGTGALAGSATIDAVAGNKTAAINVTYTAVKTVNIVIDWTEPSTNFSFTWDGTQWTSAATAQDLTFGVNNKGTSTQTVTFAQDTQSVPAWIAVTAPAKEAIDLAAGVSDTVVYTIAPKAVTGLAGLSVGQGNGTINFNVTVADPAGI